MPTIMARGKCLDNFRLTSCIVHRSSQAHVKQAIAVISLRVMIRGHPFMTSSRRGRGSGSGGCLWTGGWGYRHVDVYTENYSPLTSSCLLLMQRGHPFMTYTKQSGFWPPSPPVHMRPHGPDPPPCGRPHAVDMKYTALLKWLVQWPTGPKTEIRLYDSNLFKLYY